MTPQPAARFASCPEWCQADHSRDSQGEHLHASRPAGPAGVRLVQETYADGGAGPVQISAALAFEPLTLTEAKTLGLTLLKHCVWATAQPAQTRIQDGRTGHGAHWRQAADEGTGVGD